MTDDDDRMIGGPHEIDEQYHSEPSRAAMDAGIDRLLRGAVGIGDQTPRDLPLSPFEAEALVEAVENAIMWLHDVHREIPAEDVAEQESRNERIAHLQLLRVRLLTLHFGDEVPR
jgi:hypothetical protein